MGLRVGNTDLDADLGRIDIPLPDAVQIGRLLRFYLEPECHSLNDEDIERLAQSVELEDCTADNIRCLVDEAASESIKRLTGHSYWQLVGCCIDCLICSS